ncbi:CID domain-containing protein [Fusarium keratoplasticum]|nr:CID domain-containing protein [Fusarium keratoplasticum]
MATPELVIAKATLSATLFRADPTSLSRPVVDAFFPLLTNALSQCSRPNVQKCKVWIVDNVAPSPARIAALAKYLGILSKSLQDDASRPSLKRKRLHLLYVLNDVFYHVIKRKGDGKFATLWDGVLPGLVASAAAFDNCPKHKAKLENLIRLWEEKKYFGADIVSKLKDALASGVASQPTETPQISNAPIKLAKDAPYTLPSLHGDPSTPWYDLPATTWLPHLTPNSTKPMIPDLIRPIQLAPGPADKVLVDAVQGLLGEVERMFSREQKLNDEPGVDLNELGERVLLDEITGEIIGGETYYGWSQAARAPDQAATLEGVREAHHATRTNVDDSHETREAVVSPAAGVRVNTGEADHTAEVAMEVEVDVAVPATPLAGVQTPVDGTTVPGDIARTADLGLPNAHLAVMTGSFMTVQIALLRLRHNNSRRTFLQFLHREISPFPRLPRLDIKAPGHRHRLLRI